MVLTSKDEDHPYNVSIAFKVILGYIITALAYIINNQIKKYYEYC